MSVETAIIEVIPSFAKPEMGVSKKSYADTIYRWVLAAAAISVLLIIAGTIYELTMGSRQSIAVFGLHFFTDSSWDPNANHFGALPFILGTLYSSFWALVLALPISIFTAIFFRRWLRAG
jgi:phosphate transport system permease protein